MHLALNTTVPILNETHWYTTHTFESRWFLFSSWQWYWKNLLKMWWFMRRRNIYSDPKSLNAKNLFIISRKFNLTRWPICFTAKGFILLIFSFLLQNECNSIIYMFLVIRGGDTCGLKIVLAKVKLIGVQ